MLNTNLHQMLKDMKHWSRTSTAGCSDRTVGLSVVVRLREDKGGATREDRRPDRCHVTDTEQLCQREMNWDLLTAAPSCRMYRSCAEGATRVSIAYIVRPCVRAGGRARVCDGMRVCLAGNGIGDRRRPLGL
jgi:hypothetical protein